MPAAEQVVPVDVAEEGVSLDAGGAAADIAQAPGAVDGAEGADDVFGFVGYGRVMGKCDWFFDDSYSAC